MIKNGLFFGKKEIERARKLYCTEKWPAQIFEKYFRSAREFDRYGFPFWEKFFPKEGAAFTHGYRGCPECRGRWIWFGADTCDFSRPEILICPKCGYEFRISDPSGAYYDLNDGVRRHGETYKLRAVWNAFVVKHLDMLMQASSYLWAVTGDESHGKRAVWIAEKLARLSPTTTGPAEMPKPDGRFLYFSSIVNRRREAWCVVRELLSDYPPFEDIRELFDVNLLREYLYDHCAPENGEWRRFHNHDADTIRAAAAVGITLGDQELLKLAADTFPYLIENTIDNRGWYAETSPAYTNFTIDLFSDLGLMLTRHIPLFNAFKIPKLRRIMDFPDLREDCGGLLPRYGDAPGDYRLGLDYSNNIDFDIWLPSPKNPDIPMYGSYWYSCHDKSYVWQRILALCEEDPEEKKRFISRAKAASGEKDFFDLFFDWDGGGGGRSQVIPVELKPEGAALGGYKGIAIQRSGDGFFAALMQTATPMPHGHDDILGVNYFGLGRDMSLDIGYELFSSPFHYGFYKKRIAHNSVVVDRDEDCPPKANARPSNGRLLIFSGLGDLNVTVAEAKDLYKQAGEYRRANFLINLPESGGKGCGDKPGAYFLDVFHIKGGRVHDYSFHGSAEENKTCRGYQNLAIEHLAPSGEEDPWTLAVWENKKEAAAFINHTGRSWGERIIPGGNVKNMEGDAPVGDRGWCPDPQNGYGWLYDIKTFSPDGKGVPRITWTTPQGKARLWISSYDGCRAALAKAPELYGEKVLNYCILRHGAPDGPPGLETVFSSCLELFRDDPVIHNAEILPLRGSRQGLCVKVTLASGIADYILYNPFGEKIAASLTWGETIFDGFVSFIRTDKGLSPEKVSIAGKGTLSLGDRNFTLSSPLTGKVSYAGNNKICYTPLEGEWHPVKNDVLFISNGGTTRTSPYLISGAAGKDGGMILETDCCSDILGVSRIKKIEGNILTVNHPLQWDSSGATGEPTDFYDNKPVENKKGFSTRIVKTLGDKRLLVENPSGFRSGDELVIRDFASCSRADIIPFACYKNDKGLWTRTVSNTSGEICI
ncbi:MAG: alginate lyase family protein [Treponema sp.]|nr:alginate lyase family protein [Treponema sp.]